MNLRILVLFYSRHGGTRRLAEEVAFGSERVAGVEALLRTVPEVSAETVTSKPAVPDVGAPYASLDDLADCDGLLLGSPTRFGNMAAPLQHFFESTTALWLSGALADKPAGVFCTTGSMHGGQESTLLAMQLPLLHHGMLIAGLPFTHRELNETISGGTPYGASHVAGASGAPLTADETSLARAQGQRVAQLALRLRRPINE